VSELYKSTFRGYLIDHHSPNPPVVTLSRLDIDEYERFYKEAAISNLMVYCKDHWGVTYYDTAVGKRHPGLKEDWIAKLAPVLRRNKIEFNAYYCLEYDCYAPSTHPDWAILKADGTPLRCASPVAKWRMACYETGYRAYALTQLSEIVRGYHPDSLFLDIFGKSLCYCPVCRGKFKARYGYELPATDEGIQEKSADVGEFLEEGARSMLKDIIDTCKAIDPSLKITINFAALYSKTIRDMLDYQFTEPWAGNWLSAAYSRDTAPGQYPQLGPGNVSEVYDYKDANVYEAAAAQIAAQGCRVFMYSGSQHPDGTLEHEEARHLGVAYRGVSAFEEYLRDRKPIVDIGIVQSDASARINNGTPIVANAIGRVKAGSKHRTAVLGAMRLCDRLKYGWEVVPEETLLKSPADKYRVLLLPNVYHVSASLAAKLASFVAGGGCVVSAGETGLFAADGSRLDDFALRELYGCGYHGSDDRYASNAWSGYLERTSDPVWAHVPDTTPPVGSKRYSVKTSSGTSIASFIDPAVEVTAETWVNWWSPPPGGHTGAPAIVENSRGKGKVLYAAFDLFDLENEGSNWLVGFMQGLFERYIPSPRIRLLTQTPEILGAAFYAREAGDIIVHELSMVPTLARGDAPAIAGGSLVIGPSMGKVTSAELVYPRKEKLAVTTRGDGSVIELPALSIHQIARIAIAKG
jgi:hypothetical protein